MMWTDNPVLDAEEWYCEQEHRQTLWENRCIKCDDCGDPIDPNFDTFCYVWGEAHWHIECLQKKLKKWIPDEDVLEMVIDALDEVYKESTPEPEEDY